MSRPEPVLVRQAIAAVFVLLGLLGLQVDRAAVEAVSTLAVVGAPLVAAYLARKHVTPLADPVDGESRPLEPAA